MSAEGTVRSVRAEKKEAEVEVNGIRLRLKFSDLLGIDVPCAGGGAVSGGTVGGRNAKGKGRKNSSSGGSATDNVQVIRNLKSNLAPRREINVIGLTVAEAIAEIDPFLDAAAVSGMEEVKIIHGFGMGRLKKGIHEYLRTHRGVESFRAGAYGEGEGGVTIVRLK